MKNVLRFNPYYMEDDIILYLSTGREKEIDFVLKIIERNEKVKKGTPLQHILLIGPRGSGKSFFLRLIQIHLKNRGLSEFVLLPEEQLNIFQPADLIRQIKNKLLGKDEAANIADWSSNDIGKEWENEIQELEKMLSEKHCKHIVAAVENFDLLLKKDSVFKDNRAAGLLRKFLTEKSWITLIATTLYPDIESQYDHPIFHFFARRELDNWKEREHLNYLEKVIKKSSKGQLNGFSRSKIKALTRFTGGSPRITVIMVDVLTHNQLESTAGTLQQTIDELTPFYQDLIGRMPNKSKLLFDALIRGGEPCTQSELAQRVGTTQNIISRHFNWLQAHGYLFVETMVGKKFKLYSVRDRLLAHFYKMRCINGPGKSMLTVMSEFLTHFYNYIELKPGAPELYKNIEDVREKEWTIGQKAARAILMGKPEHAWEIIDLECSNPGDYCFDMVKQLGDAVIYYCQNHEIAKAYKVGRGILTEISKRGKIFEPVRTMQEFFINLLSEKVDLSVISDLVDEAVTLFGVNMKLELDAITGTLGYLRSKKDKKVLIVMEPEKRKAVEAILEELPLK